MENNQFYLKKFSFKHELFHNSPRILFDVKKILSQESILADKMLIISAMFQQSIILNSSSNSINLSELLLLCEIILCFIKELLIRNNNILILDLVNQWLKLARYNITYTDIFKEFSLKHIIAFYELIEEQAANSVIHDIDEKFKISLTQQIMDSINNIIDYDDSENQSQRLIPAKAFVLALKRFIYRFLLIDSGIENMGLYIYFLDFTLNLWTSDMKRELVKKLFPTCLLVSHAYSSYVYLLNEIEKATIERQNKSFASTSSSSTRKILIKKYKKFTD
ncbi:13660_t:CDS:2 [Rhizophagus irregularis]|nr:13660_t:CDS:2 [Rhizophagus irregularis]